MVTSLQARELLSPHGKCVSQDITDWSGTIQLPEMVRRFYTEVGPRDIEVVGYGNGIRFPSLNSLWNEQSGYRWNGRTKDPIQDWPTNWLVVATCGGNPYIFEIDSGRILFAFHGTGTWEATEIFTDLNSMAACIGMLGSIILEAEESESFTDEEDLVAPEWCKHAMQRLTELLGSSDKARLVITNVGWDDNLTDDYI